MFGIAGLGMLLSAIQQSVVAMGAGPAICASMRCPAWRRRGECRDGAAALPDRRLLSI